MSEEPSKYLTTPLPAMRAEHGERLMGLVLPVNGSLLARLVDSMAAYYPDREIVLRVEGEALDFWAVAKIETPNG